MLDIFVDVVLPVFLMAGVGALMRRLRQIPADSISQLTLYVFAPSLVFNSLATTALSMEQLGKIALFVVCLAAVTYVLALAASFPLRLDRETTAGFQLATIFMNVGNYGLPVALLGFGQEGLEFAVVFFVCQATLGGTLAVFIASRSQLDARGALLSVLKMPLMYATLAGLTVNLADLQLPATIGDPARILGNAAVPAMLMVLGIQLATRFKVEHVRALAAATFLRLIVGAGIAFVITPLLGIDGLLRQVVVVLSAMPTAVFTIIISTQFQAKPAFVTSVVVLSTLLSLGTLTLLITLVNTYL